MKLWLSAHIFYFGDLNKLLLECISPLVNVLTEKKIISKYFFIRYWEGGPHIRLRLYGEDNNLQQKGKKLIESYVQNFFSNYPAALTVNKEHLRILFKKYSILEKGKYEDVAIRTENSLEYIDYIPELTRYGGETGVKIAEDNFHLSSIGSLVLLRLLQQNKINHIAIAVKLMIIALALFNFKVKGMLEFTQRYYRYWQKYISKDTQEITNIFETKYQKYRTLLCNTFEEVLSLNQEQFLGHTDPIVCSWAQAIFKLTDDLSNKLKPDDAPFILQDHILLFLASILHMNNNRLGIIPAEESYLGYLINRTLMDIDNESKI